MQFTKSKEKVVEFDKKMVNIYDSESTYNVTYILYYCLNKEHKEVAKHKNVTCFSGLCNSIKKTIENGHRNDLRVRFFCNFKIHENAKTHLSKRKIARWFVLCKRHKLMPTELDKNYVKNGVFDIGISDVSINMLYMYLLSARAAQEIPHFVRAVVYFHDFCKISFFTSVLLASRFCVNNLNHHFLKVGRTYGGRYTEINNKQYISLDTIIKTAGLFWFVNGEDSGKKIKNIEKPSELSFSLHNALQSVGEKKRIKITNKMPKEIEIHSEELFKLEELITNS